MAQLKVDTERVIASANNIKKYNQKMSKGFRTAQKAIKSLDKSWDGSAATNAIGKFNAMKDAYYDARHDVVDNFVQFLYHQVGEGYTQTEEANKSLADQFK